MCCEVIIDVLNIIIESVKELHDNTKKGTILLKASKNAQYHV